MPGEYITDEAWEKMFLFLKSNPHINVKTEKNLKLFVEAIYWLARTGAQWRELPEKYGKWNSVFKRFNRWTKVGIWKGLMDFCKDNPDEEYVMIDATIVRAHACSAGYGKQEENGLGRSKGGFTCKIHAKVDALGNPLKFIITSGQSSDIGQAKNLLGKTTGAYVLGDKGYDADEFRESINQQKCIPVIPGRSNRKKTIKYDKHIYKERSLVECFFSKIKHFRRVFSRFDKSVNSFLAFLYFVGTILWLR